jgi:hypothetical protein
MSIVIDRLIALWRLPTTQYDFGYYEKVRFLIGLHLSVCLGILFFYSTEIFSNQGVFPDHGIWGGGQFPSLFKISTDPIFVGITILLGVALSLMIAFGKSERLGSLLLWYLLSCLNKQNPFVHGFFFNYAGMALIGIMVLPARNEWRMPRLLNQGFNYAVGFAYTASGISKLKLLQWRRGTAVAETIQSGLGHDTFFNTLLLSSPRLLEIASYTTLVVETCYLPLFFFRRTRPFVWCGILLMHVGIAATTYITKMSIMIILFHFLIIPEECLGLMKKTGERASSLRGKGCVEDCP